MNGKRYLLDTCTLIGLQKQSPESVALLAEKGVYLSQCGISVITYIEFVGFHGADKATSQHLMAIAQRFTQFPISNEIRDLAIALRQHHKIKLPDTLILATAKAHNLTLLTLDEKLARIYQQTDLI
ncbi:MULTISPECIES: type II toxin-antitoxin system VapC family toxin [Alysiella]|uniref:PIN domain n=2 Tax=Alysiella TaxID=194195 RepID=A0A376BU77_9NEIS|nr:MULTISPECIES: type II toxin-antitoxin system VapC family toxin [Alysiella]QMT30730.1 type II toxin-antitoxin system VapC family toxin [Alysiella filiformis]UBQ56290.1 type II toxin-antitoxin system VapC family toxin [Alysiella filiformis DSM 16848]UOP06028.1 type II toxin-antitoxin system VapC family toxin [Alysiella crassa]SOD64728.1 hypothetical protein SAMN02746062_00005 [Alysiella filiformis DSM 16848]SSY80479.1 PIN domain [Alysiella crassa]